MSNDPHSAKSGHGGFEQRDIGVSGVIYFLVGLAVFGLLSHFAVTALYSFLDKQNAAQQEPVSPMVNAPTDTRHLPAEYTTDAESHDYEKYLNKSFPAPQLETDERTQLETIRQNEEQVLRSYDYVDKSAGTVRIPIDRAMDLIAQRGLPTRPAEPAAAKKEAK